MQEDQPDEMNVGGNKHMRTAGRPDSYCSFGGIDSASTIAKPDTYCSFDGGKTWTTINGRVDSGAGSSIESLENHAQHCIATYNLIGQQLCLKVGSGQTFSGRKKGLIHLRVNGQVLPLVRFYLWTVQHGSIY